MVTIKIEIGFDKEWECKNKKFNVRKAAWLAALADSVIWLVFGVFSLTLLCSAAGSAYALFFISGILVTYLIYLLAKARILSQKYGRSVYRKEFGNTGFILVAASVLLLFFQSLFCVF